MEQENTLTILAREIGLAFTDWIDILEDEEIFSSFMYSLGWDVNNIPSEIEQIRTFVSNLKSVLDNDGEFQPTELLGLFGQNGVNGLIEAVNSLSSASSASFPDIADISTFKNRFPRQFLDFILINYLSSYQYKAYSYFRLLGIITSEKVESPVNQSSFLIQKFEYEKILDLINDPFVLLKNAYKWNTPEFDFQSLIDIVTSLIDEYNKDYSFRGLSPDIITFLTNNALDSNKVNPIALNYTIFPQSYSILPFSTGLQLFYIPQTNNDNPGFAIIPYVKGQQAISINLTENLSFTLSADFDFSQGVTLSVIPEKEISIATGINGGIPSINGSLIGEIKNSKDDGSVIVIVGSENGSNLQLKSLALRAGGKIQNNFSLFTELEMLGGKIIIKPSEGEKDSFLSKLLPEEGFSADANIIVGFDTNTGFYFRGSGGLEIAIPAHIDLGVIEILNLTVGLMPKDGEIPVNISASIKGNFGPIQAVVENIGLSAIFSFPDNNRGNLGPLNASLGFKPPNGVGLAIDASAVKGGGYLFFDHDREEYAGALELVFSEWIALKAIGLITTKMPDGSKGFSMVIIITAEFGSGIQLGFGFTLLGVGGILGVNRVVNVEPLKEGVRTGAIESVLFPQDVIANAPRIISDLKAFFPVQEGPFLIGPMAKIGYGTPTLASISLGVIIEFPDVAITILGVVKVILPDENADILRLQVNFLGRVEPSNKLLWFYAELYDSRILTFTLEGGMGLLVRWGDDSNFVFSVGGFHPRYTPPPLPFPIPPRLAINILNEPNAKIRIEGYFAVTSNTVQFGARAEMFFGFSALNVEGHLGFDVLVQFNPFYFIFEFSAGLSIKVFGFGLFSISVKGSLEGPTRWHIKGKAKWKITWLGPTIRVNINESWGREQQTELPSIAIFPLVEREFDLISNWQAVVPQSSSILVSLRKLDEPEAPETRPLVLHPVGKLRISQRKIPLELQLDKFGNQRLSDVNKVFVNASIVRGPSLEIESVMEKFARGEFQNLSKSERLSSPDFEDFNAGMDLTTEGTDVQTSMAIKRVIRYETVIMDNNFKRFVHQFYTNFVSLFSVLSSVLFTHFLKGNVVTKATISATYQRRIKPNIQNIEVRTNEYTVAHVRDNTPLTGEGATTFRSKAMAMDYLKNEIKHNPNLEEELHVIPNTEVNQAVL